MNNLIERLFKAMSEDLFCMAEYGDDTEALREELENSSEDILKEYAEIYLQ